MITYDEGLRAQDEVVNHLRGSSADIELGTILGLEHQSVITLGKRGRVEEDLEVGADELKRRGIELHISPRGGQATLHSPGQLVIYPCVSLMKMGLGVRDYVSLLEKVTQAFLKDLGLEAKPDPEEPGLYTAKGKIAFFGIRVTHAIASHGIAINAGNDLSLFKLIRSCGKASEKFDAIKLKKNQTMSQLFALWVNHFRKELEHLS